MMVISGQVKRADLMGDSGVRQKGPQEVDIVSMVKPITKYAVTILDEKKVRYHLEKAVHLATTGRRGPVWLDIPLDVQASMIDPEQLEGFTPEPARTNADQDKFQQSVTRFIELLNQSERPIILAGHGIRLAEAAESFRKLYEMLNIPVVTTWNAMDLIPSTHPLSMGKPGTVAQRPPNFAVQNSDLLIAIGARLDNVVTAYNPAKFGRVARKVLVDVDQNELSKFNMPIELAVCSDAHEFIKAVLARVHEIKPVERKAWHERCALWKKRFPVGENQPMPESGTISHYHLTRILSEEIPENTLVVTGSSGLAVEIFYSAFQNKPGQRVFLTSGLGAMGYGIPAMIGAGMANGKKPFVGIESDGSLQMNLQELLTLKALNLPVRIFIMNNGGYASIRSTQRNYFDGRLVGTGPEAKLLLPDIVGLAEVIGIPAVRITDASELRDKVRQTLRQPGLSLCEVQLAKDEVLWPKSSAIPQADGSMISMPLEDMTPLLSREELRENMIIPLDPASEKVDPKLTQKR
jgi:acetolactate synthase-1/2/3 large subunit